MKITFEQTDSSTLKQQRVEQWNKDEKITAKVKQIRDSKGFYGMSVSEECFVDTLCSHERGMSLTDLQNEASNANIAIQQDYKTVLAHTMSEKDFAKMSEEGFDLSQMDPEEVVTIVDKIKAELAKSGEHIVGYTDEIDVNTLAEALGSKGLATEISASFREVNIPFTKENIRNVKMAWDLSKDLTEPTDESYRYMVEKGMEPEIWNYYLAQSSGVLNGRANESDRVARSPLFYAENIDGYYAKSAGYGGEVQLEREIEKVLQREGLSLEEENKNVAKKLLSTAIPVTGENIVRWQNLERVDFPLTEEKVAKTVSAAIANGVLPIYGNLNQEESIYNQAARIANYYENIDLDELSLHDVTMRRQLEEVRFRMTAEVNVKLLKSGFTIDTGDMEALVEALRQAEREVSEDYFPDDDNAVTKYEQFQKTNRIIDEMPTMPAIVIGRWSMGNRNETLSDFHEQAALLKMTYIKAEKSYEALMTVPNRALGDHIKKAFENVDDILEELDIIPSEKNRRAVRILGYNRMDLSKKNIEIVREADAYVTSIIEKMTPATVLGMIRDGMNPLEKNLEELDAYLTIQKDHTDPSEEMEDYSRFLYKLEKNHEITEDEKTSFIGIYRMLRQIEKTDGAALGTVLNVGAELHFSTLLSAVRSGKVKSIDVTFTEKFGERLEMIRRGESITEQIAKGFFSDVEEMIEKVTGDEELEEQYRNQTLQEIRRTVAVDAESVELLIHAKMPETSENLLAAQGLLKLYEMPFVRKNSRQILSNGKGEKIENLLEHMESKETFVEAYGQMAKDAMDRLEEELYTAEESVDVRSMKLQHKEIAVATSLSREEDYIFPLYIGEELAKVRLRLTHAIEEKGNIDITVDFSEAEHIEAQIHAEQGKITGILIGNNNDMVTKLQELADIFSDSVKEMTEGEWLVKSLPIVSGDAKITSQSKIAFTNREVPNSIDTNMEVEHTELYRIAKCFLTAMQK